MQKIIKVRNCLNCPLVDVIIETGDLFCSSGSMKLPDNRSVGNLKDYQSMIPEWCPLDALDNEIELIIKIVHDIFDPEENYPIKKTIMEALKKYE
ncbi:MAG: hypothetical protein ACW990_00240 [Promethearchaeota archaeon]|jgi:hypothetical protein